MMDFETEDAVAGAYEFAAVVLTAIIAEYPEKARRDAVLKGLRRAAERLSPGAQGRIARALETVESALQRGE
jgi:hypothetical protein